MTKEKVALYIRLSKEDKDKIKKGDDSESIQNQELMLRQVANKNNWTVYDIYKDEDISGAGEYRPSFERLLKDAKEKKFNIVICKTQSRFTRDMEVVERVIHTDFQRWGIRFIGVVDAADTAVKGNKKSRQIHGLVNEWYIESLSESIRGTFKTKMEAGQYLGSFAPYGYEKKVGDRHQLIEDKVAANVVRRIFKLYLEGYGTHRIAKILTEDGILKPTKYKQSKGENFSVPNISEYNLWGHTIINRILRNPIYIGVLTQGKETTRSYKDRTRIKVDEKDWIVIENAHEAIIDRIDFERVQELLDSKRRVKGVDGKAHIFATKLKCRECSGSMIRTMTRTRNKEYENIEYAYFKCKNNTLGGKLVCEHKNRINYNELYKYVYTEFLNIINKYEDNVNAISETKRKIRAVDYKAQINQFERGLKIIETEIKQNGKVMTDLYIDKSNRVVSEDIYITISENLKNELELLKKQKISTQYNIKELRKLKKDKGNIEKIIKNFLRKKKKELTHDIILEMIDYIDIGVVQGDENRIIDIYRNL